MPVLLWFNDLPLWQSASILTIGASLVSLVGTVIVRILVPEPQLRLNNVFGGFKFMFLSHIYAGFIGFLLFGVYNSYDQVRATIVREANALYTLDRLAGALPEATQAQLRESLRSYAHEVIDSDWPQMRARSGDPFTTPALDDLNSVYTAIDPTSKKQQEILNISRKLLTRIADDRGVRIFRSNTSLPVLLWAVTIFSTIVAIVLPWAFGTPNINADMIMSLLSIVMMTSIVLVVLKLSYPFGSSTGITPAPFIEFAT